MSQPLAEPAHLPPATGQQVRARAAELAGLAARHGITRLAVASPGRLRGHADDGRDLSGMFEFQRDAAALLGARGRAALGGALADEHRPRGPRLHRGGRKAVRAERTRANHCDLGNHLAQSRLPDIGEALVRRFTWSRAGPLRQTVQDHLRRG